MEKIHMKTPIVEMDGDEMTWVLWRMIKDELILPYVELKTEYYDLGLTNRNDTDDRVTIDAANAIKRLGVGVKCATITPNAQRMVEYPELKRLWPSPNGTLRSILDGTVFRAPITVKNISPAVTSWESPITVARHAYGDVYGAARMKTDGPGTAELRFTGEDGSVETLEIKKLGGPAVLMGMHNTEKSIASFAESCFRYAIDTKQDLWFCTKDTITGDYDGMFKALFECEYVRCRDEMERLGITYFYTLIDDAVSRLMRSKGGFVWALKNYDGDVLSDLISAAFGSLAMMTSALASPDGNYEYEAAHGTVTKHYYRHLKGEETSTNPAATIFAWSGALRKRGELDAIPELCVFADSLERAVRDTIEEGKVTGDLAALVKGPVTKLSTGEFISEVAGKL